MATKSKKTRKTDFAALQAQVSGQFSNLHPSDPSQWPMLPRALLLAFVAVGVMAVAWFTYLSGFEDELIAEQAKETELRQTYETRLVKAVNLEALKKQREQIQQYVTQLERQLPSKAEMAALLSDVNQAGLGRSLQFDLFRPGQIVVRPYYAELPIALRVTGRFHDIGSFAADVANLSRIVTLNNISIVPARDGALTMDATARTFRYLDPEEIAAQQAAAKGAKK
ncbi:type 4a pilus biogenesis protein PilO [Pseudorhodoferax sp.]|uniref:type 4a pilus biogenesis protein PilO n=1 Tax=Pseudorhodoferax sp. TaxID=1993553 RepID=UPI002DD62C9A|nr:type 4a pilus biogenesis protein PilO [Pseudorhodoferax sp.]